jgi:hypothetical protein
MDGYSRLTVLLFGFLLAGGCGQGLVWVKPGVTETQLTQERYICMRDSGYAGEQGSGIGPALESAGAGFARKPDPYMYVRLENERKRGIFLACMEASGYQLVRAQTQHPSETPPISQEKVAAVRSEYERIAMEQASEDPIIGLWSSVVGAERITIAIVKSVERSGQHRYSGIVVGGSDSFVSRNGLGSQIFRLTPTFAKGTYDGESVWCQVQCNIWRPTRVTVSDDANQFSAFHSTEFEAIGGKVQQFVRMPTNPLK